jgi:CheY-like chemotaxis protein/REP element-mobilizing transposase RayT
MARLKKALEAVDFEVRAVGRPKAALRAIEKNQYDVAVIDLQFDQDEIFQLTEAIRHYQADSPIILSGQYETDPDQVSHYHAQAFVNKPYIARDLIQIIEIALEKNVAEDKFITPNMDFVGKDVLDPLYSPTPEPNYWLEVEPPPDEEATIRDLFLSFYDPEIEAEILREVGGEDSQKTLPPSTLPESVNIETMRAIAAPLSQQNEPPLKKEDSPAKSAIRLSEDKTRADTLLMNITSSWSNSNEQPEIRSLPSWSSPTSPQDAARIQALIGNTALPNHLNEQFQNETMHHDDIEDPPYGAMTQPLSLPEIDLLAESPMPLDVQDTPPPSPNFPQQVNPQLIEALINAQTLDDSNLHAAIQQTTGDIKEHKTQPIHPIAIDEEELVATSVEEITRAMGVILPDNIANEDDDNQDDFDYEEAEDTDIDIDLIETDELSPDAEAVNELLGEMDVIAHAALQLTQYSLESSALGTMLTHNDYPVARTGEFSDSAWQEVLTAITVAWEDDNDSRTRILYRPITEIGDVLLFSTRTVDDLTLTMVFGADTPLRIIRRQVMRLSDALAIESDTPITIAPPSHPIETQEATFLPPLLEPTPPIDDVQAIAEEVGEVASHKIEDDVAPAAQTLSSRPTNLRPPEKLKATVTQPAERVARASGTYVGYACFWMLESDNQRLDPTLTNALERWILRTANKHDWDIIGVEIGDSWINLHIEIPVKEIPSHVIHTFMEATAQHLTELAKEDFQNNAPIWAPSYTVTTPGRLLESYEIERFMHYYQQQSL